MKNVRMCMLGWMSHLQCRSALKHCFLFPIQPNFLFCIAGAGIWQGHFEDVRDLYFIPYDTEGEEEKKYDAPYNAFLLFWTYIILFQVRTPDTCVPECTS